MMMILTKIIMMRKSMVIAKGNLIFASFLCECTNFDSIFRKNSGSDPKTPSRKKSSKRKKTVSEPLKSINEDLPLEITNKNSNNSNEEENENEGEDQISDLVSELESEILSDDDVFGEHNAEVSLCQLINETFKFSEDDDYFDFD